MFLNFGRDAQAEDVLKEALKKNPANIPVQLKLLTIYANRKDVNAFTSIARQVKDSGDAAAWEQAAALGRAVDSSNPMYGGGGGEPTPAAAALLSESGKPGAVPLDMDVGFNIPMDLDVTSTAPAVDAGGPSMDFDVSGYAATPAMDLDVTGSHPNVTEALLPDFDVTGGRPSVIETTNMDFDVTGSHPNVVGTQNMDFDVTGSHPNVVGTEHMDFDVTGSHPNVVGTEHMDFDVTGSHPAVVASAPGDNMSTVVLSAPMDFNISPPPSTAIPAEAASTGLGAMDFDISSSPAAARPVTAGGGASALGGMDFDISSGASAPAAVTSTAGGEESFGLGGMDFDISSGTSAPAPAKSSAVEEEPSGLGGMDFDLSSSSSMIIPAAGGELSGLGGGMDFDVSSAPSAQDAKPEPAMDLGLSGISLNLGEADTVILQAPEQKKDERWQEVANKLDLARAFQDMGDVDTARELLGEVLNEGDAQQIEVARTLIQKL